jgi:transcriptional regulator with XRE-family HTH domain
MQLTDAGRKKLAKFMVIQEVSARGLSAQVGWKSHTILLRLLKGQQSTVTPDKAARIAVALGVGVDDLFVPRVSSTVRRPVARSSRKAAA